MAEEGPDDFYVRPSEHSLCLPSRSPIPAPALATASVAGPVGFVSVFVLAATVAIFRVVTAFVPVTVAIIVVVHRCGGYHWGAFYRCGFCCGSVEVPVAASVAVAVAVAAEVAVAEYRFPLRFLLRFYRCGFTVAVTVAATVAVAVAVYRNDRNGHPLWLLPLQLSLWSSFPLRILFAFAFVFLFPFRIQPRVYW